MQDLSGGPKCGVLHCMLPQHLLACQGHSLCLGGHGVGRQHPALHPQTVGQSILIIQPVLQGWV